MKRLDGSKPRFAYNPRELPWGALCHCNREACVMCKPYIGSYAQARVAVKR